MSPWQELVGKINVTKKISGKFLCFSKRCPVLDWQILACITKHFPYSPMDILCVRDAAHKYDRDQLKALRWQEV